MNRKELFKEFMNSPAETHSSQFGFFFGFAAGFIDPVILLFNFSLILGALGGYTFLDMAGLDRVIEAVKAVFDTKFGVQIRKEIQYFALWTMIGFLLGIATLRLYISIV
jgi:hypothetical protein